MWGFSIKAGRGFTLLEMLIVLTIVGMAAAMVVPRLVSRLDRISDSLVVAAVGVQLRQLPRRVRLTGVALELSSETWQRRLPDGLAGIELASPLILVLPNKLQIAANGTCMGGEVQLVRPGAAESSESTLLATFDYAAITCTLTQREAQL